MSKLVFWFEEIGQEHNEVVGKKCANLGQMTRMGLPVPPGFVICIDMYRKFIQETGALKEMSRYISDLGDLKDEGIEVFNEASRNIRGMIEDKEMPKDLREEIVSYYKALCDRVGIADLAVSVRSAATESRPGMFETYLNVKGEEEIVEKAKKVWASAFTLRAIAYRVSKGLSIDHDMLGVAVPKMVNARAAGVSFSIDPVSGDSSKIIIEANWGLGEGVVSGAGSVDRFIVDKQSFEVMERQIGKKDKLVASKEKGIQWEEVPSDEQSIPCLSDEEIKRVAELTKILEDRLGRPQDVEWAVDPDFPSPQNVFLLQTRPAKVAAKKPISEQMADRLVKSLREVDLSKIKVTGTDFRF